MGASSPGEPAERPLRTLTVAHVRDGSRADSVDVMFLESARIFRLLRTHPRFDHILERLQQAQAEARPVRVTLVSTSDVIEDVQL